MTHSAERSRIWLTQRTQPWVVRGDHHGAATEQLLVAEQIAERRNTLVVETAARLVEDQNVRGCRKGHDNREATSLTIGESARRRVKQMVDVQSLREQLGARCVA